MNILHHFGKYIRFLRSLFTRPEKFSMYWKEMLRQMNVIGIESVLIIAVVSMFIGAVTAIQFAYQVKDFAVPAYFLAFVIRDSMIIEMAPTISCMILAGKVGSNIASELGNMRITEQIDALEIMGINTTSYLVGTKIIAALYTIPLLIILAAALGILGGLLAALSADLTNFSQFNMGIRVLFNPFNVQIMILKGLVFAFLLSSISCYQGFFVKGGAVGIGEASTRAVVYSNILILIADYAIADLMLN